MVGLAGGRCRKSFECRKKCRKVVECRKSVAEVSQTGMASREIDGVFENVGVFIVFPSIEGWTPIGRWARGPPKTMVFP